MHRSLVFLLGLLAGQEPAVVAAEDFAGEHGDLLRLCQRLRFISMEPFWNPCPSCPHCGEGVPYELGNRFLCGACQSTVSREQLLLWRLDHESFLSWLSQGLNLKGDVRRFDRNLWQLGTLYSGSAPVECFFYRSGTPGDQARQRLLVYRSALVLRPLTADKPIPGFQGTQLCLLELLSLEGQSLTLAAPAALLQGGGAVRFDEASGVLRAGATVLGELALGSKEHAILTLLWRRLDEYVPYSDLKHFVLRQTGSQDTTEEATFCQRLKSRIKKKVPDIDGLITTTNKGDGYRLRRLWI